MRFLPSGRPRLIALVAVVVGLAAGGIAYAAIPDATGVIHGCYAKDGALRVIDSSSQSCDTKRETALNWNQAGARGPTGPAGPAGAPGPSGAGAQSIDLVIDAQLPDDRVEYPLATLANGVTVTATCTFGGTGSPNSPNVLLRPPSGTSLWLSGWEVGELGTLNIERGFNAPSSLYVGGHFDSTFRLDVTARTSSAGSKSARLDLHGFSSGTQCHFWGIKIEST